MHSVHCSHRIYNNAQNDQSYMKNTIYGYHSLRTYNILGKHSKYEIDTATTELRNFGIY